MKPGATDELAHDAYPKEKYSARFFLCFHDVYMQRTMFSTDPTNGSCLLDEVDSQFRMDGITEVAAQGRQIGRGLVVAAGRRRQTYRRGIIQFAQRIEASE